VTAEALEPGRKAILQRRIRVVVALTITWNVIEAFVALAAGGEASSAALIGFGLDSVVEVLSAVAVAWQFASSDPERREKTALRVIAISFFALAVYVTTEAALSLTGVREPEHSTVGIVLAALSLVVMPFLSWFERRCGRELGSASAVADSKQTLVCSYLSAALLVGLVLNSLLDWTWADPVAALVIAGNEVLVSMSSLWLSAPWGWASVAGSHPGRWLTVVGLSVLVALAALGASTASGRRVAVRSGE